MAVVESVSFGTVYGKFIRATADSADAGREPDANPIANLTVNFTPSISVAKVPGATVPVIVGLSAVQGVTDANGVLIGPDGQPGVTLLATDDPDMSPVNWTWSCDIAGLISGFSIAVPSGSSINLANVVPVPSSGGTVPVGGGGGGGTWGSITGSLSSQTDLNVALGAKLNNTDAPELIRDTMGGALVAGSNITLTVNDVADTITISSTGGGGGGGGLQAIEYSGSAWPTRPVTSSVVQFVSTKYVSAPIPSDMAIGDIIIRHPDAP